MHVLISVLPFAAFIIKAVKTDTAGGGGSLPTSSLRSLLDPPRCLRRDEEVISIYHFLS